MKKIILAILISAPAIFLSCEKKEKETVENICPTVMANAVPLAVKDSFAIRYPATNVINWFNKDSIAFCAHFITAGNIEMLAQFANNGRFIKEEIETQQNGQHEDSTRTVGKDNGGCECDIHKKSD